MTSPDTLIATFQEMEAQAKREVARKHKLAVGLLGVDEIKDIAMRAAEQHGIPWPEARRVLIDSFATRAN